MQEFNSQFKADQITYFRKGLSIFTLQFKKLQKVLKMSLEKKRILTIQHYKEKTPKTFKKEEKTNLSSKVVN